MDLNGISARLISMVGKAFEAFWPRQIGFLLKMRLSVHEMDGERTCMLQQKWLSVMTQVEDQTTLNLRTVD